ncbi:hypothetical protein HDU92_007769 [Lobulomyces angularis]|nr:hypothetical protein HDU92_007769 [Lobulomyces angularis]
MANFNILYILRMKTSALLTTIFAVSTVLSNPIIEHRKLTTRSEKLNVREEHLGIDAIGDEIVNVEAKLVARSRDFSTKDV